MIDRIDAAHRRHLRDFFVDVRQDAGQARDHEQCICQRRWEIDFAQNRRHRAIDVDGQFLAGIFFNALSMARAA